MNARSEAVMRGLMLGESLSWKSIYDRSHLLPFWTRRKRREIEAAYEGDSLLEPSLPFALNQPTEAFRNAPGPNSEWVALQLSILIAGRGRYEPDEALARWQELASERASLRLTIAQHAALANIAGGKRPPVSGYDNPHYFDDGACFRAIPLVLLDGRAAPDDVLRDACITNAQDGVWAAQAFAAALRAALDTSDPGTAVSRALSCVPSGTWTAIETERAIASARRAGTLFELIDLLNDESINHAYNYGNSAPETLALTLAVVEFTEGDPEKSLLAALALPKTSGSVAPLVAALCCALGRPLAASNGRETLRGIALPRLAGTKPLDLLDELEALTR